MPYIPPSVATTEQSKKVAAYLGPPRQGKVRDIWEQVDESFTDLLIVTTDRASSNDRVLGQHIPGKGIALNGISVWMTVEGLRDENHHLAAYGSGIDMLLPEALREDADLQARSIFASKKLPLPMECVARGYITGSGWASYKETGEVCGIKLPKGLREGDKLDEPIFTPTTKSDDHDLPLTEEQAIALVGEETFWMAKARTLSLYKKGLVIAEKRGIILADTKFEMDEFGCLIDEVLTPDSSRYWPRPVWEELQAKGGGTPPSLDKQYLRDLLKKYNFAKLTPEEAGKIILTDEERQTLADLYHELLFRVTGYRMPEFKKEFLGIAA